MDQRSFQELQQFFRSDPAVDVIQEQEEDLYFQEIAYEIAKHGMEGASFLLGEIPSATKTMLQAILVGLASIDKKPCVALLHEIRAVLVKHLTSDDPDLVAKSIESLNRLGFADTVEYILPLLGHKSPFVMGSVLRYLARHFPTKALALLQEALDSPEPIVRQTAIDELDELDCKDALPKIRRLVNDPDAYVRQAAITAAKNLQEL